MDLLELEPEESEGDFLQEDLVGDVETARLPLCQASIESQELLDQVFGEADVSYSAPSFGDELSLLDSLSKCSDFSSAVQPPKDSVSGDHVDEGFDPFEDSEATIESVESFGDGPLTRGDLRDRLKNAQSQRTACRPARYSYRDRDGVSTAPPLKKVFAATGQELSVARVDTTTFFDTAKDNVADADVDSQGGDVFSSDEEEGYNSFIQTQNSLDPSKRATHRGFDNGWSHGRPRQSSFAALRRGTVDNPYANRGYDNPLPRHQRPSGAKHYAIAWKLPTLEDDQLVKTSGFPSASLSKQPKVAPPRLDDGITFDTPKNFRVPRKPRAPTPPPQTAPQVSEEATTVASQGGKEVDLADLVASVTTTPSSSVSSKPKQSNSKSTTLPPEIKRSRNGPSTDAKKSILKESIDCSEAELEARLQVTPPGSPIRDVVAPDDAAWLPEADDAAWLPDRDELTRLPRGIGPSASVGNGAASSPDDYLWPPDPEDQTIVYDDEDSLQSSNATSASVPRAPQGYHPDRSSSRDIYNHHRSNSRRRSNQSGSQRRDVYGDYHRRKEEEKELKKKIAQAASREKEQKKIQDYVSEHLAELLEKHLKTTPSEDNEDESRASAADSQKFETLNCVRHEKNNCCGCKDSAGDGKSFTVNCFTSITFWISSRSTDGDAKLPSVDGKKAVASSTTTSSASRKMKHERLADDANAIEEVSIDDNEGELVTQLEPELDLKDPRSSAPSTNKTFDEVSLVEEDDESRKKGPDDSARKRKDPKDQVDEEEVCEIETSVLESRDSEVIDTCILISDSEESEGEEEIERPSSAPLEVIGVDGGASPDCIVVDSDDDELVERATLKVKAEEEEEEEEITREERMERLRKRLSERNLGIVPVPKPIKKETDSLDIAPEASDGSKLDRITFLTKMNDVASICVQTTLFDDHNQGQLMEGVRKCERIELNRDNEGEEVSVEDENNNDAHPGIKSVFSKLTVNTTVSSDPKISRMKPIVDVCRQNLDDANLSAGGEECDPTTKRKDETTAKSSWRRKQGNVLSRELASLCERVNYPSSNTRSKEPSKKRKRDASEAVLDLCSKKSKMSFGDELAHEKLKEMEKWKKKQEEMCRAFRRHRVAVIKRKPSGETVASRAVASSTQTPSSAPVEESTPTPLRTRSAIADGRAGDVTVSSSIPSLTSSSPLEDEGPLPKNLNRTVVQKLVEEEKDNDGGPTTGYRVSIEGDTGTKERTASCGTDGSAEENITESCEDTEDDENALLIDEGANLNEGENGMKRKEKSDAISDSRNEKLASASNGGTGTIIVQNASSSESLVAVDIVHLDRSAKGGASLTASVDKCDYCKDDEIYDDHASLRLHIRQRHRYRCQKCFVDFGCAQERYEHLVNCERFMERRKVCEFCETIIFDTLVSEERHNRSAMHLKCVHVYEKAYDKGMDKLMKNMLKNQFDVEKFYAKTLEKDEERRREKMRRREERSQVFVSVPASDANLSVASYALLDQVEGRDQAADAREENEGEEARKGKKSTKDPRKGGLVEDAEESREGEIEDSLNEAATENEATETNHKESAELASLSRSAAGDQPEQLSDAVLPDFENPETNDILSDFLCDV